MFRACTTLKNPCAKAAGSIRILLIQNRSTHARFPRPFSGCQHLFVAAAVKLLAAEIEALALCGF